MGWKKKRYDFAMHASGCIIRCRCLSLCNPQLATYHTDCPENVASDAGFLDAHRSRWMSESMLRILTPPDTQGIEYRLTFRRLTFPFPPILQGPDLPCPRPLKDRSLQGPRLGHRCVQRINNINLLLILISIPRLSFNAEITVQLKTWLVDRV